MSVIGEEGRGRGGREGRLGILSLIGIVRDRQRRAVKFDSMINRRKSDGQRDGDYIVPWVRIWNLKISV